MPQTVLRSKVVVVGNSMCGKSCLTSVFHTDGATFPKNYSMTIGAELGVKTVTIPESPDVCVELYVFDVAGQDIYKELVKQYLSGTSSVVFVYDVTNPDSFRAIPVWVELLTPYMPRGVLSGALVATKCDMVSRAAVKPQEGNAFAKHHTLSFFEVSAKDNKNVEAVFVQIARTFYSAYEETTKSFAH